MNWEFGRWDQTYGAGTLDSLINMGLNIPEIEERDFERHKPSGSADYKLTLQKVVDEMILIRPRPKEDGKWNDRLFEYLIQMRGSLANKTVVVDMVNFKQVPLSVLGWFFLLKKDLERENSSLILTGLVPKGISPSKRKRVLRHFEIQESFSGPVSRFANN